VILLPPIDLKEYWAGLWCSKVLIGLIILSTIVMSLTIIGLVTVISLLFGGTLSGGEA
jgi:hypothetical protein